MPVKLTDIKLEDNYLHVYFEGKHDDLSVLEEHCDLIITGVVKYKCTKLLLDYRDVHYKKNIIHEQIIGEFIAQVKLSQAWLAQILNVQIAILSPKSIEQHSSHLEQVARNRGINLRVFFNFNEAVSWLLNKRG